MPAEFRSAAGEEDVGSHAGIEIGEQVGMIGIFVVVESEVFAAAAAHDVASRAARHRDVVNEPGAELEIAQQESVPPSAIPWWPVALRPGPADGRTPPRR